MNLNHLRFVFEFDKFDFYKLFESSKDYYLSYSTTEVDLSKKQKNYILESNPTFEAPVYADFLEKIIRTGLLNFQDEEFLVELPLLDEMITSISTTKKYNSVPQLKIFMILSKKSANLTNFKIDKTQFNNFKEKQLNNLENFKPTIEEENKCNSTLLNYFSNIKNEELTLQKGKFIDQENKGSYNNFPFVKNREGYFSVFKNCKECKLGFN